MMIGWKLWKGCKVSSSFIQEEYWKLFNNQIDYKDATQDWFSFSKRQEEWYNFKILKCWIRVERFWRTGSWNVVGLWKSGREVSRSHRKKEINDWDARCFNLKCEMLNI